MVYRKLIRKPWFWIAAAFLLPVAVMFIVFAALGTHPFGSYSSMYLDMNAQYVFYFEKFREIIFNSDNLLYAWERALGGEFLGIFFYYLCSPFTALVLLFPRAYMLYALWAMVLCKFGACGATFYYYLSKSHPGRRWQMLLFSLLYALCGYGVVQNTNTMWIDAMYLLPLMLLGLERLIGERKFIMYTLLLTAIFVCNYYIGWMVAIFTAIYFFYYYFSNHPIRLGAHFWKTFGLFAIMSIIAALIACIAFVPAYYSLTFGKTTFQDTDYSLVQRFDFLDFFTKLLPSSYDTVRPQGLPMVYSGVLSLLFLPLYFFSAQIPGKKKILSGGVLALLVLSMNASSVDLFWHGLSMPNWLNYRYSFVFSFMVLVLAFEAVRHLAQIPYRSLAAGGVSVIAAVFVLQKFGYETLRDFQTVWFTVLLVLAYLTLFYPLFKKRHRALCAGLLSAVVIAESGISAYFTLAQTRADVGFGKYDLYVSMVNKARDAMETLRLQDPSLYRTETNTRYTVNMPLGVGNYGVSHSTSTLNASVIKLLGQFGYTAASHSSQYRGGNPVSDALLGIRYLIYNPAATGEESADTALYQSLYDISGQTENNVTYRNPYALSVLYTVSSDVDSLSLDSYPNSFERLNAVVGAMLGESQPLPLFVPMEDVRSYYQDLSVSYRSGHVCYTPIDEEVDGTLTFTFQVDQDAPVYAEFPTSYYSDCSLYVDGTYWGETMSSGRHIHSLGSYQQGDTVTYEIESQDFQPFSFRNTTSNFYYLDLALYQEIMSRLAQGNVGILDWSATSIDAEFTVSSERDVLLTTIPQDSGWHVSIDGERVDTKTSMGALISVDVSGLEEGTHRIEMTYFPDVYWYGIVACLFGIALFLLAVLLSRRPPRDRRHTWKSLPPAALAAPDNGAAPDDEAKIVLSPDVSPPDKPSTDEPEQVSATAPESSAAVVTTQGDENGAENLDKK